MPEGQKFDNSESDLARGLAEFRQGRKSLLPEFELPTDDKPIEEPSEIIPERLIAYNFEQVLKETNAEERLKDPNFLQQLTNDIDYNLETGKTDRTCAALACIALSATRFLGIKHSELTPEKLISKLNEPDFLKELTGYINNNLERGKVNSNLAASTCLVISASYSLEIKHSELTLEKLNPKLNDPDFLQQLIDYINYRLEQGKTDSKSYFAASICSIISAIHSLGIKYPELISENLDPRLNNPDFLKQLTEDINHRLEKGKTDSDTASYVCRSISAIQNLINYYSAIADEKEKAEATHKLQTAADSTGVPPRPEVKAF